MQQQSEQNKSVLVVFAGLLLVMLMAALDQTIVSTALPTIVGDLGGLNHISWVVTAYLLAQTIVTPVYGKLGDQFGRKVVLQVALVIFLIGSALCGLAGSLPALIVFRAIQGLGGGGLMVGTMAAIGDVVSPRDRGRYQGFFGAVFGLASVIGPLLGGFLTSSLSWRWIFYVNVPVGVLAFAVLAATLPSRRDEAKHQIDYLGAGLLAAALAGVVLLCTFGGVNYGWTSPFIIVLALVSLALIATFVRVEHRAAEPVLPPRLFTVNVFLTTSVVGLVVGFALFGSVTYLPLFLQVVRGATPTTSGLQILPLMAGLLITSISSGQIISRTGRYKPFPIVGTFVMVVGLFLLSTMDVGTSQIVASLFMFVLGLGLGMVMQVLVLAVQNAVDYKDLGVATSGATLFRSIGGCIGTAILGSIFSSHLASHLATNLASNPSTANISTSDKAKLTGAIGNPASLDKLSTAVHDVYIHSFTSALNLVFEVAAAVAVVAFVFSWLIKQLPLRESVSAGAGVGERIGETFAVPKPPNSGAEIIRALSVLIGSEGRRHLIEQIAARAGVDLSAAGSWLLTRIARDPDVSLPALCEAFDVPISRAEHAIGELQDRGMILRVVEARGDVDAAASNPPSGSVTELAIALRIDEGTRFTVTERGGEAAAKLVAERQATLARLLDGWKPEQHADLLILLSRLADEVGRTPARELVGR